MAASLDHSQDLPRWPWLNRRNTAERARPRSQRGTASAREKLLVVGNGMVGQRFCDRLVETGGTHRYAVTVLGEEALPAYDRVHLTDIWQGRDPEELVLRGLGWYREHGIDLKLRERVVSLDREARRVTTEAGAVLPYDKLVFATGSRATTPPIAVEDGASLLFYRTIEDAGRILESVRSLSPSEATVAVIGGGLLGLEAARTIQKLGYRVVVFEGSSQLLPRQLDPDASRSLEQTLARAGIEIRLRARIERVRRSANRLRIALQGADSTDVDIAVVAAGARACDEVARHAGLRCHARGGIEVDRLMRTADPAVYAIGECAAHSHVPHGLVAPGYAMADVLVDNLMGQKRLLEPQRSVTRLKLDLAEVNVLGNPLADGAGRDLVWQRDSVYRRLVVHGGRVVAAVTIGPWSELPLLQQYVAERRRLEGTSFEQFAEDGLLGLADESGGVQNWPDEAVVCQCATVTCGRLRMAIAGGATTPAAVAQATKASTLCGSCEPLVASLCGVTTRSTRSPDRGRGLLAAGVVALLAALAIALSPRIPVAMSIQRQSFDIAFIDSFWKQLTGFSILGLVFLGLTLSLRKRVRRFRIGNYSGWRLLHGALGAGALVALGIHTGFRLGANLNMALMLAFLVSAATGAGAGMLTVAERGPERTPLSRWANITRSVHDYAFWPLSVLVAFHVIKVYYF